MNFKIGDKVKHDGEEWVIVLKNKDHQEFVLYNKETGYYVADFSVVTPIKTLEQKLMEMQLVRGVYNETDEKPFISVNLGDNSRFNLDTHNLTENEIFDKCTNIIKAF